MGRSRGPMEVVQLAFILGSAHYVLLVYVLNYSLIQILFKCLIAIKRLKSPVETLQIFLKSIL